MLLRQELSHGCAKPRGKRGAVAHCGVDAPGITLAWDHRPNVKRAVRALEQDLWHAEATAGCEQAQHPPFGLEALDTML